MAAQMAQKVQHPSPTEGGTRAAAQAQEWLNEWENRMDNTLSLLYGSAISRGLPHKLTRNLHTLSKCRKDWVNLTYDRPAAPWRPTGEPVRINLKNAQKSKGESGELAWNMVGEVVRMAEGRDQLMLGRAPPRRRKTYRNLD